MLGRPARASASSLRIAVARQMAPTTWPGAAIWHSRATTAESRPPLSPTTSPRAPAAVTLLPHPVRDIFRACAHGMRLAQVAGLLASDRHLRLALLDDAQERVDERGVELPAALPFDLGDRPRPTGHAALYGRFCVSASNTSATATMRPASGMAIPGDACVAVAVPALVVVERDLLRQAQDREAAARQDARADRRVRLHQLELLGGQLAQLQQDRIRNADLADVVQRRRAADQRHLRVGQSDLPREQRRHLADPLGVLPGVVVAELRRPRQPLDDLDLRRLELARAVARPSPRASGSGSGSAGRGTASRAACRSAAALRRCGTAC